jgi:hypothetical protein
MKYRIMWDYLGLVPSPMPLGAIVYCSQKAAEKHLNHKQYDNDRCLNDVTKESFAKRSGFIVFIEKLNMEENP